MASIISNLNPAQKEAVTYTHGPLLVLAGAGSGKTRVLTYRVAYLLAEGKVMAENVLLLTFTNKAAGEMKERMGKLLMQAGKPAETSVKAGTFHSFCAKILRIDGKEMGIPPSFLIYDTQDQKQLVKQILEKLNLSTDAFNPAAILASISDAKNQMLSPTQYAEFVNGEFQEVVFKVYSAYEKRIKENQALDFDDLLLKATSLLKENAFILAKWQEKLTHVFVDEWQDTNKIQYTLIKMFVGKNKNITAVGDASQSIYSWRGADYRNINYLIKDFPDIKIINLEQNYRSTQNILDAANGIISQNTSHPILKLWTENPKGQKIKIYTAKNGFDEAGYVTKEIKNLRTKEHSYSDVAVLYRTNAQSRVLEEVFLHAGIPYVLVGGVRFYERKEVRDILSYLRLLVNPKDSVSKKRIEKIGKRRLEKFNNLKDELCPPSHKASKGFTLNRFTTLDLLDKVLDKTDYLSLFSRESEENLARLENIKELRSVATEFPNIDEFLENVALVEAGPIHESKNCVTLMTLHAAKGLEFPVVFIVGMEEGLFPHSKSLWDKNQLEEERRLAYVGMTRAKELLYLSYASRRIYFGEKVSNPPSRFLVDIPEDLLETNGEGFEYEF
ncbi:MAG: UvrD-helicase domain-containing protein [bacterium]|nr:UvrD-helicase domain-containing protein [bacterium]